MLLVWCAYGTLRASSFSSVLHIGQTVVEDEDALAEEDVYAEWHAGVLRADSPADKAICRSGKEKREVKKKKRAREESESEDEG